MAVKNGLAARAVPDANGLGAAIAAANGFVGAGAGAGEQG